MLTVDLDKLAIAPGQICLDVGCGEGRHTLAAYLLDGVLSIGVDLSKRDLATARGRVADMQPHAPGGVVGFAAGDATALPMADNTIDVVIASEILEHIPNYLCVLEEAMRVLRCQWRVAPPLVLAALPALVVSATSTVLAGG